MQADFDSAESASGRAETNKQKDRSHHHQQASQRPSGIVACVKRIPWSCGLAGLIPGAANGYCSKCLRRVLLLSLPRMKKQTMQSSPCQPDFRLPDPSQPQPKPHATLSMHTQAPRKPSNAAWHNRPSATNLCAPRSLRRIFLSSIWVFPRFFGSFNRREIVAKIT